jgi:uncharacterized oligopeptide transporter (OPT) family protein
MMMVIQGIMNANLPWGLVFVGAASAVVVELLGIGSLSFAIGLYLPIHTSVPIMIGGLIKAIVDKITKRTNTSETDNGILYGSGLIAGDALMGVIIAMFASAGINIGLAEPKLGKYATLGFFIILVLSLVYYAFKKNKTEDAENE